MCASPLSPRHAQPDWMGGGLVSRQMMHAPPSAAISVSNCFGSAQADEIFDQLSELYISNDYPGY
jgi:hypothetical protein